MILGTGQKPTRSSSRNTTAINSSPTRSTRRRRHLRAGTAADAVGGFLQIRGAGIRNGKAHPAAARPGGFEQIDHGPAAEERAGAITAAPTRANALPTCGACRIAAGAMEGRAIPECPMHEEPLLLIPREARGRAGGDQRKTAGWPAHPAVWRHLPILPEDLRPT
jgi:hypothetical protein